MCHNLKQSYQNKGNLTTNTIYHIIESKKKRNLIVVSSLLLLTFLTIVSDFLFSQFQNTSFYLSESLLFSSFWLLFIPLLAFQFKLSKRTNKFSVIVLIATLLIIVHLFVYPAIIWLLSNIFYNHTFSYWQTFNFEIPEYFIKTAIIYSLPITVFVFYKNHLQKQPATIEEEFLSNQNFITSIIVSGINNIKTVIATNDILYFSANSPYINIHHKAIKYLHKETLKSLEGQLDNEQFIRIHKSYIVNIYLVISYKSRLNGDYDLTLCDGTLLRVSRNYVQTFKTALEKSHRLAIK